MHKLIRESSSPMFNRRGPAYSQRVFFSYRPPPPPSCRRAPPSVTCNPPASLRTRSSLAFLSILNLLTAIKPLFSNFRLFFTNLHQNLDVNPSLRTISSQWIGTPRMLTSQRTDIASLGRNYKSRTVACPFDICIPANECLVKLDKPLQDRRNELEFAKKGYKPHYLRPGMVLLKNFIGHRDQVKIVNICRDLGIGCGGFYRPEHANGAKLNLQMMCLGKDWDPQSRLYNDFRSFDGAKPPGIPEELRNQVDVALHAAHEFLKSWNSEKEIPSLSPDICIVNFYSSSGKLGLHQDKDESRESLKKGLPVVSFSVGDSAEFLYSDIKSPGGAEKVILESGDVLIFGGKSRHVFHGVSQIMPNTMSKLLAMESNLRPGRLNLTFRQY